MALRLQDCPPELRAKIEAQLAKEPKVRYAMATFLNGTWTVGPSTTNRLLIEKLTSRHNLSTTAHAHQTRIGKPPAIVVEIE